MQVPPGNTISANKVPVTRSVMEPAITFKGTKSFGGVAGFLPGRYLFNQV